MLCSRICCSSENAWICFTLKFRKRRKREFQLLLFHSVMHQRQCGIIEKSNFVWTKFPCVIPVQPIQGQAQTVSTWNFLILLFAYLSLCRLHDGKSLPAISKSPLDRQQLGHPWGSKTEFSYQLNLQWCSPPSSKDITVKLRLIKNPCKVWGWCPRMHMCGGFLKCQSLQSKVYQIFSRMGTVPFEILDWFPRLFFGLELCPFRLPWCKVKGSINTLACASCVYVVHWT